jgi:osmoprotectant transport system substrate-binding protein
MTYTRRSALVLIGAAALLPSCGTKSVPGAVRVGSKDFGENITIAEIYAAALERAGIPVERHMNLGSTQIATEALQHGDIDLYPEYTGTGLIDVLHLPPMHDARALFKRVKDEYERRFDLTWLDPSPVNDSQALATTPLIAEQYNLLTLSECAVKAPQLRFAAIPEFVVRADALPGLQRYYGGFQFKSVRTYDIGLQYDALARGDAEVATAFTTDAQIQTADLIILRDDRNFWPAYNVAPVVRMQTLRRLPRIAQILRRVSPALTNDTVRRLNVEVNVEHVDPAQAAAAFVQRIAR